MYSLGKLDAEKSQVIFNKHFDALSDGQKFTMVQQAALGNYKPAGDFMATTAVELCTTGIKEAVKDKVIEKKIPIIYIGSVAVLGLIVLFKTYKIIKK